MPTSHTSFKASAAGGPSWLKNVASSLGRGEPAVVYCISCWLVPEVGDFVVVLEPPYGETQIKRGSVGKVVEVDGQGHFRKRFLIEFTGESGSPIVQHMFYSHQVQAAGIVFDSTIPVSLHPPVENPDRVPPLRRWKN